MSGLLKSDVIENINKLNDIDSVNVHIRAGKYPALEECAAEWIHLMSELYFCYTRYN